MFRLLKFKPPRGWSAVAWELGIVTLGVLIALAAQQLRRYSSAQRSRPAGRRAAQRTGRRPGAMGACPRLRLLQPAAARCTREVEGDGASRRHAQPCLSAVPLEPAHGRLGPRQDERDHGKYSASPTADLREPV